MSESDSDKKPGDVPSWQVAAKSTTTTDDSKSTAAEAAAVQETPKQLSRDTILETARKFLDDEKIRDASTGEKVKFLESKGLEKDVVQELLGVSRNIEASNMDPSVCPLSRGIVYPNTLQTPPISPSTAAAQAVSKTTTPRPTSLPKRDAPPVITYPEFLTTPTQPAPLVTTQRLLTTLYLFGGLSALLYGTSTYLVAPMLASLTESRHTLSQTAQSNLDKLISKLEGAVSELPPSPKNPIQYPDSESDSDPTELFHRDVGVQTSLPTTPTGSRPQSPPPQESALDSQTDRLSVLKSHITDLNSASTSEGQDTSELSTSINVLRDYLNSLAYSQPTYTYGAYGTQDRKDGASALESDKLSELKAQIRQVKGVLLAARTFPGSVRGK